MALLSRRNREVFIEHYNFIYTYVASYLVSPSDLVYLVSASDLQRVSDLGARWRLRSSSTSALVAPRTVRATIGDRAFPAPCCICLESLP